MQYMDELKQTTLRWAPLRPGLSDHELRAGDTPIGALSWSPDENTAYAELGGQCWVFCREQQQVQITMAGRRPCGTFVFGWEGGVLYLANGATFHWGCNPRLGRSEWVENGLLLRAQYALQASGATGQAELAPGAAAMAFTPLLVVLDRYLMHELLPEHTPVQRAAPARALRQPLARGAVAHQGAPGQ